MDGETQLVHTVAATAANVADSKVLRQLPRGDEIAVWGDQAYQGQAAVLAEGVPRAADRICRRWRSNLQVWPEQREANRIHSKTRSRVEHVTGVLKLRFGFIKVRYRGLSKNSAAVFTAPPRNSNGRSAASSDPTTMTQKPSSGIKQQARCWNPSPTCVKELPIQDTRLGRMDILTFAAVLVFLQCLRGSYTI